MIESGISGQIPEQFGMPPQMTWTLAQTYISPTYAPRTLPNSNTRRAPKEFLPPQPPYAHPTTISQGGSANTGATYEIHIEFQTRHTYHWMEWGNITCLKLHHLQSTKRYFPTMP